MRYKIERKDKKKKRKKDEEEEKERRKKNEGKRKEKKRFSPRYHTPETSAELRQRMGFGT